MPAMECDAFGPDRIPGDRIVDVKAESQEEALRGFAAMRPRSEGFMKMVERGPVLAVESGPQAAP